MSDWTKAMVLPSQEWEHIQTQLLATQAAAVTFTGIAPLYRRFMLQVYGVFQTTGSGKTVFLRFNSDATSPNYRAQYTSLLMLAGGASVSTSASRQVASGLFLAGTGITQVAIWCLIQKAAASLQATVSSRAVFRMASPYTLAATHADGHWVNTANLINRIDVQGDFGPGTRILLAGARDSLT